jgi:hypothetical protein
MLAKNLLEILGRSDFRKDGPAHHVATGVACSVYLGLGDDALVIDRVTSVEIAGEIATIVTMRREHYSVEVAEIRAVRVTPENAGPGYR